MHAEHAAEAPMPNQMKPYRVSYYKHPLGCSYHGGDFRWYWQAYIVSFFRHYLLGQGCNTWKYKPNSRETE